MSKSKSKNLKMPDFSGLKAFVLDGAFYGDCVILMAEAGFSRAQSIKEADVVVFIGGADINPEIYRQKPLRTTYFCPERDRKERKAYDLAQKLGKVCFGICRGMQLLAAYNGARLWQHVDKHAGPDHEMYCIDEDYCITVTSVHHQMVQYHPAIEVIGCTYDQVATEFNDATRSIITSADPKSLREFREIPLEIEAGYCDDTRCFFVQGHPEIGNDEFRAWTMTRLMERMEEWNALPEIGVPMSQLQPVRGSC